MKITIIIEPYKDMIDIHLEEVDDARYNNLKFGINYRVFVGDEWIPIVRYDNHLHKKKAGKHLHRIDRDWESPETVDISLTEARKLVEELGRKLREKVVNGYENKNTL